MQRIILQICFAIICFQAVCCSVSRSNLLPFSNLRRQTQQQQCVLEQIDEHFSDNSQYVECTEMLTNNDLELSDEQTDEEQQAMVDQYFELLCTTECGDFIFAVSEECGVGDASEIQAVKAFCGSNSNKDICYELFTDYFNYYDIELNCTVDYYLSNSGTCECESELETAVDDLGCCIDAYHQLLVNQQVSINPRDIYDSCDVDLPTGCPPHSTTIKPTSTTIKPTSTTIKPTSTNGAHYMYIFYMLYAMVVTAVLMA